MKHLLYAVMFALYLAACTSPTTEQTALIVEEAPKATTLTFNLDYADWSLEDTKDLKAFEDLFKTNDIISLSNINISTEGALAYTYNQGLGDITIQKQSDGNYNLLEYYIIPIGNVYGKVALLNYVMDVQKGTIKRDKTFKPQLQVYKYWYNHIVKEYDSYLENPSYTSKNLDDVPHAAFDIMRFLMFNLTLAAIEGCDDCANRMQRITEDYSFVQSAEYSQNLMVCQTILKKFEK